MNHYFLQITLILLINVALQMPHFSQTAEPLAKRVGEISDKYAADGDFSGSVLFARNGEIVYQKSFGFADRETKTRFDSDTLSSIASIGKIFTAALILKLTEEKNLSVSDPVSKFLPDANIPNAGKITIHQLLTHTSGLGNYMAHPDYAKLKTGKLPLDDLVKLIAAQPLVFETPGERHQYSNSGYIVLGKIIEIVTKKKYENVLRDKILKPLKMKNTHLDLDRKNFRNRAKGYSRQKAEDEWTSTLAEMPTPASDGGLFTTAEDLFHFDQTLFSGKIITPASLDLMKKRHVQADVPGLGKMNYGYGLMIMDYTGGAISVGHNGGSPGYGAEYKHFFIGEDEYSLIIISNYDRRIRPLLNQIQTALLENNKAQ